MDQTDLILDQHYSYDTLCTLCNRCLAQCNHQMSMKSRPGQSSHGQSSPVKASPVKARPVQSNQGQASPVKASPVKARPVKPRPGALDQNGQVDRNNKRTNRGMSAGITTI